MAYQDWQQRVIDEREALGEKCDKLALFLDSDACDGLALVELAKLATQAYFMTMYFSVLEDRIENFVLADE